MDFKAYTAAGLSSTTVVLVLVLFAFLVQCPHQQPKVLLT